MPRVGLNLVLKDILKYTMIPSRLRKIKPLGFVKIIILTISIVLLILGIMNIIYQVYTAIGFIGLAIVVLGLVRGGADIVKTIIEFIDGRAMRVDERSFL
jgi:uncharacterized membrane protein YkvI